MDGLALGLLVGALLGCWLFEGVVLGNSVGVVDGYNDGVIDGCLDDSMLGTALAVGGRLVGCPLLDEGTSEATIDGTSLGPLLSVLVGKVDGTVDSMLVGVTEGSELKTVIFGVGELVFCANVGDAVPSIVGKVVVVLLITIACSIFISSWCNVAKLGFSFSNDIYDKTFSGVENGFQIIVKGEVADVFVV